jgi:hypothetical protein
VVATRAADGCSEVRQLKLKCENLQFLHSGQSDDSDPTKRMLTEHMPLLLNTAWSLSAFDIEQSVSCLAICSCMHRVVYFMWFHLSVFFHHLRSVEPRNMSFATSESRGRCVIRERARCSCLAR